MKYDMKCGRSSRELMRERRKGDAKAAINPPEQCCCLRLLTAADSHPPHDVSACFVIVIAPAASGINSLVLSILNFSLGTSN